MRTTRTEEHPWQPSTAAAVVFVAFAFALAARALVRDGGDPRLVVAAALFGLTLAAGALVIIVARLDGRGEASDLGLRPPAVGRAVTLTVAAWMGIFVVSALWVALLGLDDDAPTLVDRLAGDNGALNAVLILAVVAVATPLGEELLFRAYLFRILGDRWGLWPGAVVASVVFAAFHVGWTPNGFLPVVFVFGLVCCLLYHRTGSLYPTLALHALFNSVGAATELGWSWQVPLAVLLCTAATCAVARVVGEMLDESHAAVAA